MKKGRQLVYPRVAFDKNGQITTWEKEFQGLNKREYFAGLAMQGMLANPETYGDTEMFMQVAVKNADALLKELEKDGSI